ncbi:phosphoribosylformylglycinamidine synthase I [Candidatus Peregrinibacteria bacterium CG_4_10_14_0_2_um_filter_43_11]|nr:MAG: phosphoribosylformylglycinamidine synthase I [Candidatus Peregrinibacteria bacterium CG_4_10_14_0_2_um_filter_43_11]
MEPKALIITGYGINCEEETAFVFQKSGATAEIVHVNDLIDGTKEMNDYQILAIPGGFSYGDDTGSGNGMANRINNNLGEKILAFAREDKLAIGICNGFQVLANLGLVPALDGKYGQRQAALDWNDSARYQDRWVWLKRKSEKCVWTKGIDLIHTPIAHGEGKFTMNEELLKKLADNDQIVFQYVREDGSPANGEFPVNPNGSIMDIAGITDPSGRILGMMPHPERFMHMTNEENWTLKKEQAKREGKALPEEGAGMRLFKNAVAYFS